MEIPWADVLPPLSVIGSLLLFWWRLDSRITGQDSKFDSLEEKIGDLDKKIAAHDGRFDSLEKRIAAQDGKFDSLEKRIAAQDSKFDSLDKKIDGVREASEAAHTSIRDDLCELKVTTATIKTDVEWLKRERQQ